MKKIKKFEEETIFTKFLIIFIFFYISDVINILIF